MKSLTLSLPRPWLLPLFLGLFCVMTWADEGPDRSVAAPRTTRSVRPWLFFDLGNTLVHTWSDPQTNDVVRVEWMRYKGPGGRVVDAREYLTDLSARGYPIGLIANIPQKWGDPDLMRAREWLAELDPIRRRSMAVALTGSKRTAMGAYFEGHGPGDPAGHVRRWSDPRYPTHDWATLSQDFSLLPFFDEYRKPDKAPPTSDEQLFLFHEAQRLANRAGTRVVYQGENAFEIAAARGVGLTCHLVPFQPTAEVQAAGFFLSVEQIEAIGSSAR